MYEEKILITVDEAMELISIKSKTTMKKMMDIEDFPKIKFNRTVRIFRNDFLNWLNDHKYSGVYF